MNNKVKILLIVLIGFGQLRMHELSFIDPEAMWKPFPYLPNQEISQQTWVYFLSEYILILCLINCLWTLGYKWEANWIFFLEFLDMMDFILIYNENWMYGIEYNDVKLSIIFILILWRQVKY